MAKQFFVSTEAVAAFSQTSFSENAVERVELLGALAARLSETRRKIDIIFELQGFAVSPACDIMLELFQARMNEVPVPVKRLCLALSCASSTGIRWIGVLNDMDLLERIYEGCTEGEQVTITDHGFRKTAKMLQLFLI